MLRNTCAEAMIFPWCLSLAETARSHSLADQRRALGWKMCVMYLFPVFAEQQQDSLLLIPRWHKDSFKQKATGKKQLQENDLLLLA